MKITSYFEIDAQTELAYEEPEHIPCASYMAITLDYREDVAQDLADGHAQNVIAHYLKVPLEYVRSISRAIYEEHVGLDEDDEDE